MSAFESSERQQKRQNKKRKVSSCHATAEDYASLREHYTFLPTTQGGTSTDASSSGHKSSSSGGSSTWQERMVARYHSHLYKDYVLANMTRVHKGQLGLRWRTKPEVQSGKGSGSCGNLHCPSFLKDKTTTDDPSSEKQQAVVERYLQTEKDHLETEAHEVERLAKLPPGVLLTDYEVPFTYREKNETKTELVKLCLCAKCAPLLFISKGSSRPSLAARRARNESSNAAPISSNQKQQHQHQRQTIIRDSGGGGGGGGGGVGGSNEEPTAT